MLVVVVLGEISHNDAMRIDNRLGGTRPPTNK